MQLAKSITHKKINKLYPYWSGLSFLATLFFSAGSSALKAQDNSPYSRFGIGDLSPSSNINTRGMAGISAGYADYLSINFNNPATYSFFEANKEAKSKKLASGRAVLDVGINFDNRKLIEKNNPVTFTASNALFSYIQVGVPVKKDWGISFGLRPISRISYKIFRNERLTDPVTGLPIDSSSTRFEGDGGSYLASAGTGMLLFKKPMNGLEQSLSIGFNAGYLFGEKDYSTRRSLINDTVLYYQGNFETKTNYGNLFLNAGIQYRLPIKNNMMFTLGAYSNWGQNLNATKDQIRETFQYDPSYGELRIDSVSDIRNVKGKIFYPASFTVGFVFQKFVQPGKESGWLAGLDYMQQNWESYRYYGQPDGLRNKWEVRAGAQFSPVPRRNYFSNVAFRLGLFTGKDYIVVQQELSQTGVSVGLGLPVPNYNRLSPYQASVINLAFEFLKRGNNDNLLRENFFRISAGFSLSDIWFIKRKYD